MISRIRANGNARALLVGVGLLAGAIHAEDRPNVLLVLLDDAGWTDVGVYGSKIDTPNMDRLAAEGMRFTDCHSAAPNCSPSRAGLLTGRIPIRAGIYSYLPSNHVMHLRDEEVTMAEVLKESGYHTGHFGKWHLSRILSDQPGPRDQGFDVSLGTDNNARPSHLNPRNFVWNGEAVGETQGYSCDLVVDAALEWLKEIDASSRSDPFFACVWFHEPHSPIASPPALVEKYQERFPNMSKKDATYHANIENVDQAIGRLMTQIGEMGLDEETFVFLTSDNGPLNRFSRVGLRGQKSNVWEGGHRVPGIFRWPGKIASGSVSQVPISAVDMMPTVCDIVGVEAPSDRSLDGVSLTPVLFDQEASLDRQTPLYWFFYRLLPSVAMRSGDYVLIADTTDADRPKAHPLTREDMEPIKRSGLKDFQLYNVAKDLAQTTNLAAQKPAILEKMKDRLESLHREVVADGVLWDIPEDYAARNNRRLWPSE